MTRLRIPRPILDAMLAHAAAEHPNECCGLLAGRDGVATHLFPLVNVLASPVAYEADPRELLALQRTLRSLGVEEVALYHSHPTSAPVPSAADLARNGYGTSIPHVILGPGPEVRAWWLGEETYAVAEWEVE